MWAGERNAWPHYPAAEPPTRRPRCCQLTSTRPGVAVRMTYTDNNSRLALTVALRLKWSEITRLMKDLVCAVEYTGVFLMTMNHSRWGGCRRYHDAKNKAPHLSVCLCLSELRVPSRVCLSR